MATYEMQPSKGFADSAAPAPSIPVDGDDRLRVDASGMATGTEADAWDMKRMGRSQELRRNFKSLSVLGLATTTMSTWVALLLANAFSLTNGGLAGTVWLYLASWIFTFSLGASLAEMASMAPTSGGQYRESDVFCSSKGLEANLSLETGCLSLRLPRKASSCLTLLVGWPL